MIGADLALAPRPGRPSGSAVGTPPRHPASARDVAPAWTIGFSDWPAGGSLPWVAEIRCRCVAPASWLETFRTCSPGSPKDKHAPPEMP